MYKTRERGGECKRVRWGESDKECTAKPEVAEWTWSDWRDTRRTYRYRKKKNKVGITGPETKQKGIEGPRVNINKRGLKLKRRGWQRGAGT